MRLRLAIILCLFWLQLVSWATVSSSIVWNCQTGGNDANGGGFKTGASGTDYSTATSPQVIIDGATITGTVNASTSRLTLTGYTAAATDVGNVVQLSVNSGALALYEITGYGSNYWNLDRALGTAGQTATGRMGGCFATPGFAAAAITVSGQKLYIKAGTYTMTTSTAGAGGPMVFGSLTYVVEGYNTSPGDLGTAPVISAGSVTGITMLTTHTNNNIAYISNLELNGQNGTGNNGFLIQSRCETLYQCKAVSFKSSTSNYGFSSSTGGLIEKCFALDCGIGFTGGHFDRCVSAGATGQGFVLTSNVICNSCIAYGGAGDGFNLGASVIPAHCINCVADGNSGDGFDSLASGRVFFLVNCLATNNGSYGCNLSAVTQTMFYNFATYNNTSGALSATTPYINRGAVTLTADPYISQSAHDYRPNHTAGGGLALRAAGIGVYGQTDARDIGAVQHADPSLPAATDVKNGVGYNDSNTTGTYTGGAVIVVEED